MERRINGILIGIFFIMAGFLFMFRNILPFNFGYLMIAFAGIEMLISHFFTKSTFFVILGSYLAYWGILHTIQLDSLLVSALLSSTVFFVPAIIFFILYLGQRKRGHLTWLCLFLLLGIDTVLQQLTGIDAIGTLLICVGIALVLDYILGATYKYTSRLQLGIFLIILGMLKMADWHIYFNYVIPAALIWLGVIFFIKAIAKD